MTPSMTTLELLTQLRKLGIKLWAEGDQLRYTAPKGKLTPHLRENIVARKAEILNFLKQAESVVQSPPLKPAVSVAEVSDRTHPKDFPLSFAQHRLWFMEQLRPNTAVYNIPTALHLRGRLDISALEQSLNEIVQRHDVLRTTFKAINGRHAGGQSEHEHSICQVIIPKLSIPLPVIDVQHDRVPLGARDSGPQVSVQDDPQTEREIKARQWLTQEAQRSFDLAHGPLLRAALLRFAEDDHILFLNIHHLVYDGWSEGIFFQEMSIYYNTVAASATAAAKTLPHLPPLPVQYADFAVWQRQWLQGDILQKQLKYWSQQLADSPPLLTLPTDRPRPATQTFQGRHYNLSISHSLTEALKALSQRVQAADATRVTLFITLLAAFNVLIYRYTGQTDIPIGVPIANRNHREIENLIGFFVNTLVLRNDLSGDPTFLTLLHRVREVALGAYAHQDLPFEQIVEILKPPRDLSYHPMFQIAFALQDAPIESLNLKDITASPYPVERGTSQFDLALLLEEKHGQTTAAKAPAASEINGELEYNTDLYDESTIARLVNHYRVLLEGIAANPEQRISRLPLLSKAERRQLLVTWNDTTVDFPQDRCVHQLFEAQVQKTPYAVAVAFRDQVLTYRDLNQRANQLAHHLQKQNLAAQDRPIAICMRYPLERIIGALAVLKAGQAYLPLDPAYPQARLAFMLKDAQVPVLLTQQALAAWAGKQAQTHVIYLDSDQHLIAQNSTQDPTPASTEAPLNSLAYVIYTSGSTGHPKGTLIEHRSLLNLVQWHQRAFKLTPEDRATQIAGPAFDASVWEIWPYLTMGASVHIPDEEIRAQPVKLRDWLISQAITITFLPTPLAETLLELDWPSDGSCRLRFLLTGGDKLNRYPPLGLPFTLINNYGPTENSVVTTSCPIHPVAKTGAPPIGRPIDNVQVYILDAHQQPVPVGIAGELCIAGVGLSRGYLNRPALTAEKFIPHPFNNKPGARLYRTGDLARYRADGVIEFLGRLDNQVKIRGFRIELGEIEAALSQHPDVQETVAVVQEEETDNKRIIAYVVLKTGTHTSISDLYHYLEHRLPSHMVPSTFVQLDTLPLTPNGKVDRQALPPPQSTRPQLAATYIAPRDVLELKLTQLWETILDIHPIGVTDNFFELGGHSLLAVRLMSQIESQFSTSLPLATLFEGGTIESLASILRHRHIQPLPHTPLVAIQPNGTKPSLFCVHPAGGNVLCYIDLARHLGSDQPCYGFQSPGLNGLDNINDSIEQMAKCYTQALRAHQPRGPYRLGGWSMGGVIAFEMARQLHEQKQDVVLLALFDSWAPGPSLKFIEDAPPLTSNAKMLVEFFNELTYRSPANERQSDSLNLQLSSMPLQSLEPNEQLAYILKEARKRKLIPPDIEHAQIRQLFQVFQANIHALQTYTPKPYSGPITLFQASEDRAKETLEVPTALGWQKLSTRPLNIQPVPGDHYTMLSQPHVQVLAENLKKYLDNTDD